MSVFYKFDLANKLIRSIASDGSLNYKTIISQLE